MHGALSVRALELHVNYHYGANVVRANLHITKIFSYEIVNYHREP